jgi:hypothetical protein
MTYCTIKIQHKQAINNSPTTMDYSPPKPTTNTTPVRCRSVDDEPLKKEVRFYAYLANPSQERAKAQLNKSGNKFILSPHELYMPFWEGVLLLMDDPGAVPGADYNADAASDANSDISDTNVDADIVAHILLVVGLPSTMTLSLNRTDTCHPLDRRISIDPPYACDLSALDKLPCMFLALPVHSRR